MTNSDDKKTSHEDWHPEDIKAALHKRGVTLAALAVAHGMANASSLSHTFTQSRPKNEQRIADAIGVHPKVIWPSRYNEDGTRKPQGFRAMQCIALENARNGKLLANKGK